MYRIQALFGLLDRAFVFVVQHLMRLWQLPQVARERNAPLLSDETVRGPAGGAFAIFVKYYGRGFNAGEVALLQALRAERVNTMVVFNREPVAGEVEAAQQYAYRVVIRKNFGRDFGAYRSALLNLVRSDAEVERLLFLNDSVFYLPGRSLGEMISGLIHTDWDVTGAFENHATSHHVGSFAFSVSGEVYRHPAFRRFWRDYRPYDLRSHAINRGEMQLGRLYRRLRFRVDALYSLDRVGDALAARSFAENLKLLGALPLESRADLPRVLQSAAAIAHALGKGESGGTAPKSSRTPTLGELAGAGASSTASVVPALAQKALIDRLVGDAATGSQIHLAFGLHRRLLRTPLVKRDLLRHGGYAEHDLASLLDDVSEDFRHSITRDLIAGQRPISTGRLHAYLIRHGFR